MVVIKILRKIIANSIFANNFIYKGILSLQKPNGESSLVEFFEDMYDYNLNSLKEYMEDKEKKKKDLFPKKYE